MVALMSSGLHVREAVPEDAGEVYALACELAGTLGDRPPFRKEVAARLSELLETPRARVLLAEEGGEILGAASLWVKPDLAHGDTVVEVPMLAVASGQRRQGVGKRLMAEVQRIAADNGANLIELVATRDNLPAREFYRSLGFVEANVVALEFLGDLEDPPDPKE